MSVETDLKLAEMVERLKDGLHPSRIYLFGSRARGEATPDSDYDLFVVVAQSDEPKYKRCQRAYSLLRGLGVSKDIVIFTQQEFDRGLDVPATLPSTVLREGRLLYDDAPVA